jgi:hypothetical protein
MMIFTDEMTMRLLDWSDWCMLTQAQKRRLVETRRFIQVRFGQHDRE